MDFLTVTNLTKEYEGGMVQALKGVSFILKAGESLAIMGPSGCGKSTLLSIIGGLDSPGGGQVLFNGIPRERLGSAHAFRAETVGFVFQFHHLVSSMTLVENVAAPMIAREICRKDRHEKAMRLLADVGLGHRANFFPCKVSGGERQRAAVVRALANDPKLLLADEPTGNLDTIAGEHVVNILLARSRLSGAAVIIATHNPEIASKADRIITMRDGLIVQ